MNQQERITAMKNRFSEMFGGEPSVWVQAPGRVDLMGSHTDYNEGYVLTMTIDRNTWIAAQPRADRKVKVGSLNVDGCLEFSLDNIHPDPSIPWANYVKGVVAVFLAEGYEVSGFNGLIHSTIPFGSGLSSSAALEVATGILLQTLRGWKLDSLQLALLCQRAENKFVGVNCGILDQYTSALGQAGHALLLDCRSLTSQDIFIDPAIQVVICDTQAERALTGCEYSERRAQCEEGAAWLAQHIPGVKTLRDVSIKQLMAHEQALPELVARRARFIIEENQRVFDLAKALPAGDKAAIRQLAANSFAGAHDLYEITVPAMVAMMDAMFSGPGVIGARQAGAGFGGCMVAFVQREDVPDFVSHIKKNYAAVTGIEPKVYPVFPLPKAGVLV